MKTASRPQRRRATAFTLVEIMVSVALISLVGLGVVVFMRQALSIYYYDSGRININRDIRVFTGEMTTNAVFSSYFMIFKDFSTRSTTSSGGTTTDAAMADGQSGDFLLLIYASEPDSSTGKSTITQVVGYYRDPGSTSTTDVLNSLSGSSSMGPVRKFTISGLNFDPTLYTAPISTLLNTYMPTSNVHSNSVVVELAQGLSDGKLFYDFQDRSVLIRGQIVEQGNMTRQAVSTYNFAVTPRS